MKPMISDKSLRSAVEQELESDPDVVTRHVLVTASDGAITLAGHVATIHEKHAAVRAAERVEAVRAVADCIEVTAPSLHQRADDEIAEAIAQLRGHGAQSPDSVGVQVSEGRVVLHGQVESESQRDDIENAARRLTGVRAVSNLIEVTSQTEATAADVDRRVQEAVAQVAGPEAQTIRATIDRGTVRLQGRCSSLEAVQTALKAAESAPGVSAVESEIVVATAKPE